MPVDKGCQAREEKVNSKFRVLGTFLFTGTKYLSRSSTRAEGLILVYRWVLVTSFDSGGLNITLTFSI